jgi:hypothetical protein
MLPACRPKFARVAFIIKKSEKADIKAHVSIRKEKTFNFFKNGIILPSEITQHSHWSVAG